MSAARKVKAPALSAVSPGRRALAEAIEDLADTERQLQRIDAAIEALGFYGPDGLVDTFDRAEHALREMKHRRAGEGGDADVIAARLLGERVDDPLPALQAARDAAARKLDEARSQRQVLEDARRNLESRLKDAQGRHYGAVRAALKSDPAVRRLFEGQAQLKAELLAANNAIRALGPGAVPEGFEAWGDVRVLSIVGLKDPAWEAAIAALEADAGAALPV